MATTNQKLAMLFQQMADVLEILEGDRFRINAFAKAARVIDEMTQDVAQIGPDIKKLCEIEGVGKGTAERIAQYLTTGKIKDHDELLAKIPTTLLELLTIPGLGPKTTTLLWKQAGITSLAELKQKLQTEELAGIKGFGGKKLENLRKNLTLAEQGQQRARIGKALPLATWFVTELRKLKQVKQVDYAGSLRRGKETIGDIDLIVAASTKDAGSISDAFVKLQYVTDVIAKGSTKTSVRTSENMQVDMRIVEPESYGAALLYFTGSKEHNVQLRERALKQGATLNEYRLAKLDGEKVIASRTEQDIYKALGLDWISPEMREARGEITLAEKHTLPDLISINDIKSELHTHTTASDGTWSIRDLALAAIERGFHTVAITDHSKGQVQAHGLSVERLEQHIVAVREVARELKSKINILAGSEVDILTDGKLDYPDSVLKELDIVVASPHAALTQDNTKATPRLLKAISNRYVTIIGHPTGRLINRREGMSPDMNKVIAAAKERGIALEINANSYRLDLRDTHAHAAIEAGVKLAINTDAHGPADLDQLTFGVLTARRAGVTKHDVINCMPAGALMKWIRSTRE